MIEKCLQKGRTKLAEKVYVKGRTKVIEKDPYDGRTKEGRRRHGYKI